MSIVNTLATYVHTAYLYVLLLNVMLCRHVICRLTFEPSVVASSTTVLSVVDSPSVAMDKDSVISSRERHKQLLIVHACSNVG